MIKAIEIKSTEECPYHGVNECFYNDGLSCICDGLDSPDCPFNAIRCETCKHRGYCCTCHMINEAISEDGFCNGYATK